MPRDQVPHSRLFIMGGRGVPEEEIKEVFGKFGAITDIFRPKDRRSGQDKAVFYVTYTKASEAALAMEQLNGQSPFQENVRSLKIIIAAEKSEGNTWDPKEDEMLVRLFIKCKPDETEESLKKVFEEWGQVEYVNVLMDTSTGKSRGLAYVRFGRAYHAALALENCPPEYRPKFAESRSQLARKRMNESDYSRGYDDRHGGRDSYSSSYGSRDRSSRYDDYPPRSNREGTLGLLRGYPNAGAPLVEMRVSPLVTHEQIRSLCDLVPGLTTCDFDRADGTFIAKYVNSEAAGYAKERLDGFEFPPGHPIVAWHRHDKSYFSDAPASNSSVSSLANELRAANQSLQSLDGGSDIKVIADFVKKASGVLSNLGMSSSQGAEAQGYEETLKYCSVPLPLPQPFAPFDSECDQRLFIVSQPEIIPEHILQDIFCRFGDLIEVFFMSGRNCGYAKFAKKESADRAISTLHGQMVYGMRLKVMLADPPPGDEPAAKKRRN